MFLDLTDDERAFRAELRAYFAALVTPEAQAAQPGDDVHRAIVRQMGADGWLGIGWPEEYGGQGRSPIDQLIFFDEATRARAPLPIVTINTVGPTLMRFGTDAQKAIYLPPILRGEIEFAIGYSEPEAGTDLAALRTRARRDGSSYVVDGQKLYTSGADSADFVWLACRTDPASKGHHGLSVLIVPTDAPGFSWTPVHTILNRTTTATYYDDVRVPVDNRVGEENDGWSLITHQLGHERLMVSQASEVERLLQFVLGWARTTVDGDRALIEREWVRLHLARVAALVEYGTLANHRGAAAAAAGELEPAMASAAKVFSSEMATDALRLLGEVVGQAAYLREGSDGSIAQLDLESAYQLALQAKTGGGTNEIQRELIASFALGMPRTRR